MPVCILHCIIGLRNSVLAALATFLCACGGGGGDSSTAGGDSSTASVPGAPTAVVATAGDSQASVAFAAPSNGGSAITSYKVTSSPGNFTGTGAASPITVAGLTNGTAYTFTVKATNAIGTGPSSVASNSVTPVVACSATTPVVSGAISLRAAAARSSGVSPLAIFFDATATTSSTVGAKPFHDIEYRWDFGDPGSGNWTNTPGMPNLSRNSATGAVAAHVYEPGAGAFSGGPATYAAIVTAFDGTSTATCGIVTTVSDPDTVFSGANTICFANDFDFTGCPAGATQVGGTTNLVTAIAMQGVSGGVNKRLLFHGGHTFAGATAATLSTTGPGIVGSFGTGKAKFLTTATANFSDVVRLNGSAAPSDWRLMDVEFDGGGANAGKREAIFVTGSFSKLTMLRLFVHDIGGSIEIPLSSAITPLHDQIFLVDSVIQRLIAGAGPTAATHGILSASSQTAILGNLFDDSKAASAEHMIRIQFMDRGVVSNNRIRNVAANKEMLALRAPCSAAAPCGTGVHFPTLLTGAAAATRQVIISDNQIDTNTFVGVKVGQVDVNDSTLIQDVILERNYYQTQTGGGGGITAHANEVMTCPGIFGPFITRERLPG